MQEGGWLGVVAIGVSGLFAWLNTRDRLRYDVKTNALQAQNDWQQAQITQLKAEGEDRMMRLGKLEEDHAKCEEQHHETQKKLDDCNEKHEQILQTLLAVTADVAVIKKTLAR